MNEIVETGRKMTGNPHQADASAEAFRLRYGPQMAELQARLNVPPANEIYTPNEERLRGWQRLYFGPFGLDLSELKRRAADPRFAAIVEYVHSFAAAAVELLPPETVTMDAHEPNRAYADSLAWMAASYLIDTNSARRARTMVGLLRWVGALGTWGPFTINLSLAQSTIGLCTVYDWLHDELPPAELAAIREQIIERARFSLEENRGSLSMWRGQRFAANHNWAHHSARGFAALTLWNENDAALGPSELQFWLDDAMVDFWKVRQTHTHDGAPLEGPGYQDYGLRFYLDFISNAENLLKIPESFYDEGVRALHARLHVLLPGNRGGLVFADGFPTNWGSSASFNFRHLATLFRDPRMQLVADQLVTSTGNKTPGLNWRDLFVYDADLAPARLEDQPLTCDLEDFGLYIARSDWSDDASYFALRCGTASGKSVVRKLGYDFGEAHAYANQGSIFFYSGAHEVLPGVNYAGVKLTRDHNLVVFEGRDSQSGRLVGQLGEGGAWFNALALTDPDSDYAQIDRPASVLEFGHGDGSHHYLCDLGGVYRLRDERVAGGFFFPEYLRSVIYLEDGTVAIVDRVRVPVERTFSFRLVTAVSDLAFVEDGFHFRVGETLGWIRDFSPATLIRAVTAEETSAFETPPRTVASLCATETLATVFAVVIEMGSAKRYQIANDERGYSLADSSGALLRRVDWP